MAQADVCGDVGGRHVSVGGCTNIAGDAVDAAVAGAAVVGVDDWARYGFPQSYAYSVVPAFPGEAPCISPTGLEYYTPAPSPATSRSREGVTPRSRSQSAGFGNTARRLRSSPAVIRAT